jgi:V8-like Glu-specific endopeptidase
MYSHPHQCIGLLCFKQAGSLPVIGTAFLIAKDLILTAAHNFKDKDDRISKFDSI